MNVGGKDLIVGKNTLLSVKGSLLYMTFTGQYEMNTIGNKVFLDRDPKIFKHMINYIRSDRKHLPQDVNQDVKRLLEMEIKFWGVDYGLEKYDILTVNKMKVKVN